MAKGTTPVKKTVALHTEVDQLVREVWGNLLFMGYKGVTYSTALNLLILASFMEALEKTRVEVGWSKETYETVREFLKDRESISKVISYVNMPVFHSNLAFLEGNSSKGQSTRPNTGRGKGIL